MGIGEALKGLLSGRGTAVRPIELASGEAEVAREVASWRPGGLTSVGGDLVLTTARLVFTPLETRDAAAVLVWLLGKAGAHQSVTKGVDRVGGLIEPKPVSMLQGTTAVQAGSGPSLLKPPTLVVTDAAGHRTEIGILAGRRAANISAANLAARDRMMAAIRHAIAGG